MLKSPISLTSLASISPLGMDSKEIWAAYCDQRHRISKTSIGDDPFWAAVLDGQLRAEVDKLRESSNQYAKLDDSVLFAIHASRRAVAEAGWEAEADFGINIGSSRGATSLFETYHGEFLKSGKTPTLSSPTTTLGNIASWVAHDLKSNGPTISHSITCSTALHALINGVAWLQSGLADKFLVGGSEASITPFTIAQMRALKIYAEGDHDYPCKALQLDKPANTMVLGEGAAVACLEKGQRPGAIATIVGMGYATEPLQHSVSLSSDAKCFQDAMRMALGSLETDAIDMVVMHAPGTIKGDRSEVAAIQKVFGKRQPMLTTNKWKIGHTFGASGMLSVELAVLMLQNQKAIPVPFVTSEPYTGPVDRVMVNAVGFGGNAVSIVLERPGIG